MGAGRLLSYRAFACDGDLIGCAPPWLDRFEGDILRCHVIVEAPYRHHHQGRLYHACIEIFVPRGDVIVTHESPQDHAQEDPFERSCDE